MPTLFRGQSRSKPRVSSSNGDRGFLLVEAIVFVVLVGIISIAGTGIARAALRTSATYEEAAKAYFANYNELAAARNALIGSK